MRKRYLMLAVLLCSPGSVVSSQEVTKTFQVREAKKQQISTVDSKLPTAQLAMRKQRHMENHFRPINLQEIIEKIAGSDEVAKFKQNSMEKHSLEIPALSSHPATDISVSQDQVAIQPAKSVTTGGFASTVCEPSAAISVNNCVLATGNWFAAFSDDGGNSFDFIDPSTTFPSSQFDFCCDQVVHYVKSIDGSGNDLMIWFLQYSDNGSENIFRIAVASGNDIKNLDWSFYDFKPTDFDATWTEEWFDYPDLAVNDKNLFITTNVFNTDSAGGGFERAVIVRLPLENLRTGAAFSADFFATDKAFSLRPTQGAGETMYFGSHDFANFEKGIKLYSWNDNDTSAGSVKVQSIDDGDGLHTWLNNGNARVSMDKQGNNWMKRTDFRMTGSWFADGKVGLAWCAAKDSQRSNPHLRVAIVDVTDPNNYRLVDQPHVHHPVFSFAYPAMAVNDEGHVGVSLAYGGGGSTGKNPAHAVGFLDGSSWHLVEVREGTHGPAGEQWGDYLSVRPHPLKPGSWFSTGYFLDGGAGQANVRVHVAEFSKNQGAQSETSTKQIVDSLVEKAKNLELDAARLRQSIEQLETRIDSEDN